MYGTGKGIPVDRVYAHMWWTIAASEGLEHAENSLEGIETVMTPAEIDEAKDLARRCAINEYQRCFQLSRQPKGTVFN